MEIMQERPPMVDFEFRPVVDRSQECKTGLIQYKDVVYVKVTPAGSKDCFESLAEDWIKRQEENMRRGNIGRDYFNYFKESYDAFLDGEKLDRPGTHIKNWCAATPAQQKMLLNAGVFTIEDLAAANEDLLKRIGMGARALQQYAVNFLESAKNEGAKSSKIVSLQNQLADALSKIEKLTKLLDRSESDETKKRGRPLKVD
jgi:hypothetical protein